MAGGNRFHPYRNFNYPGEHPQVVVKPYKVEVCAGGKGCPNALLDPKGLKEKIEKILEEKNVGDFLLKREGGKILPHMVLKVSISCCPNACSQPQIKDFGIIGKMEVELLKELCTGCGRCEEVCLEDAICLKDRKAEIDKNRCLKCGSCVKACEVGAIKPVRKGYNLLVGGKLGRHPRLATPVGDEILREEEVLKAVEETLDLFIEKSKKGERLGDLLDRLS